MRRAALGFPQFWGSEEARISLERPARLFSPSNLYVCFYLDKRGKKLLLLVAGSSGTEVWPGMLRVWAHA